MANRNPLKIGIGLILISLGLLQVLDSAYIINLSMSRLWPIFPSVIAISIWIKYFQSKDLEMIMPASILTTYSALFFTVTFSRYLGFQELWPIFILGPSLGFWLLHFLDPDSEKNYIRPALITLVLTLYFLLNNLYYLDGEYLLGTLFIIIGISIIVKKDKNSTRYADN